LIVLKIGGIKMSLFGLELNARYAREQEKARDSYVAKFSKKLKEEIYPKIAAEIAEHFKDKNVEVKVHKSGHGIVLLPKSSSNRYIVVDENENMGTFFWAFDVKRDGKRVMRGEIINDSKGDHMKRINAKDIIRDVTPAIAKIFGEDFMSK
jgi:hypothetical protein